MGVKVLFVMWLTGGCIWAEPIAGENGDYLTQTGEKLEFTLDGELWTYSGYVERGGERMQVLLNRELETGSTRFMVQFDEPGEYKMEFFRQDASSGVLLKRYVTVTVTERESETERTPEKIDVIDSKPSVGSGASEIQPLVKSEDGVSAQKVDGDVLAKAMSTAKVSPAGKDVLPELLNRKVEKNDLILRLAAAWPEGSTENLELSAQALQRLAGTEMKPPPSRYGGFPELMYRLAWMLERSPTARDFTMAHHLYHRLAQDYPAHPLAVEARQNDYQLERDFIAVY